MFAPLFLGFDLSTQALKASAISLGSDQVHVAATVNFDKDLPRHGTSNGSIVSPAGDGEITTPVELFLEAVDLVMQRLKDAGLEFGRVLAVGGAAQVSSAERITCLQCLIDSFSNTGRYTGRPRLVRCWQI
jgi:xylulokinase